MRTPPNRIIHVILKELESWRHVTLLTINQICFFITRSKWYNMTTLHRASGDEHGGEVHDEPPAYSETETQPGDPQSGSSNARPRPSPPSDAQRAQAPLRIHQTNSSITGSYLVVGVASAKNPPDVILNTTNGRISASIWTEDKSVRQFVVEAKTTNGSIDLSVVRWSRAWRTLDKS